MTRLKLSDTSLAKWLASAMALSIDPDTEMPGLSQHKLAALSGVSQAQIHEVLKKEHAPRPETLNKLAKFFKVNPLRLYLLAYLTEEDLDVDFWGTFFELEQDLDDFPPDYRESAQNALIDVLLESTGKGEDGTEAYAQIFSRR